jgi:hypothetical protein
MIWAYDSLIAYILDIINKKCKKTNLIEVELCIVISKIILILQILFSGLNLWNQ